MEAFCVLEGVLPAGLGFTSADELRNMRLQTQAGGAPSA